MERHVSLVGILFIVYHVVGLFAGLLLFVILSGIGLFSGDLQATGILVLLGIALGTMLVVVSLPGIIAGIGLLRFRPWARILALILALINLFNVPLGTALGIYTFWTLMHVDSEALFRATPSY